MNVLEKHYTPQQIAEIMSLSRDTVLRMFRAEPGVFVLGRTESIYGKKRAYATIRIPASVAERVIKRRTNCGI